MSEKSHAQEAVNLLRHGLFFIDILIKSFTGSGIEPDSLLNAGGRIYEHFFGLAKACRRLKCVLFQPSATECDGEQNRRRNDQDLKNDVEQ